MRKTNSKDRDRHGIAPTICQQCDRADRDAQGGYVTMCGDEADIADIERYQRCAAAAVAGECARYTPMSRCTNCLHFVAANEAGTPDGCTVDNPRATADGRGIVARCADFAPRR